MSAPVEDWQSQDFCYVTTIGRRTGNPHTIEIWFGSQTEGTIYLLSGGGDQSDWVKNLVANPSVHVKISDREWEGQARVLQDEGEEAGVRRLLATKYQAWRDGKPMSNWARTSLPIAIDLA